MDIYPKAYQLTNDGIDYSILGHLEQWTFTQKQFN